MTEQNVDDVIELQNVGGYDETETPVRYANENRLM